MAPLFPLMIALTLITIVFQVRSISMMTMVFATAPLGLIGVIPTLLMFQQPFGINALVGLIALSGILMRNTLILIDQIRSNEQDELAPFDAVVNATVQRSRPVILTALAAMLAFIPLTHSVFWGTLAYTLIGGTFGGDGSHAGVLAGVVRHLVPDQAGGNGRARRFSDSSGACRRLAEGVGTPSRSGFSGVPPLLPRRDRPSVPGTKRHRYFLTDTSRRRMDVQRSSVGLPRNR